MLTIECQIQLIKHNNWLDKKHTMALLDVDPQILLFLIFVQVSSDAINEKVSVKQSLSLTHTK